MLKAGIVGMPNAGKSTLFNALSESEALVAPYAFSTVETNKAVLNTRDADFESLGKALDAPDLKYSQIQLWDIAGLVEGASNGEGLGNEFLGQMKNCDLLLHVVRIDKDSTSEDVLDRLQIVNKEIALFDHKLLLKPFEKARRLTRLYPKDTQYKKESELLTKAYYGTRDGAPIKDVLPDHDFTIFQDIGLVSLKSQIVIANVDESAQSHEVAQDIGADLIINAEELRQLESLSKEERIELGFSGEETDLAAFSLVEAVLAATRKKQVYTVGHLGVGQWIVDSGANAQECAKMLHGEMEDEVQSVKVGSLADFTQYKNWQELAKRGKIKTYNAAKYIPTDKQVLLFD